jgi:hypothetical protein
LIQRHFIAQQVLASKPHYGGHRLWRTNSFCQPKHWKKSVNAPFSAWITFKSQVPLLQTHPPTRKKHTWPIFNSPWQFSKYSCTQFSWLNHQLPTGKWT